MKSKLIRAVKILLFCLLFVYLSLVALLNLPPVRSYFQQEISRLTERPVVHGYLYLNWNFNPVLSGLKVGRPDASKASVKPYSLNNLELNINWRTVWKKGSSSRFDELLDEIYVESAEVTLGGKVAGTSGGELTFPIAVQVESWTLNYRPEPKLKVSLQGSDLSYSPDQAPVTSDVDRVLGEKAKIQANFFPGDNFRCHLQVEEMQLPFGIFREVNDRWYGQVQVGLDRAGLYLNSDLSGFPVKTDSFQPPELDFKTKLTTDTAGRIVADTLTLTSDFFTSSWNGLLRNNRGNIELDGDFELIPDTFLESSRLPPNFPFKINRASAVRGQFQVRGPLADPEIEGQVLAPGIETLVTLGPGLTYGVKFENWVGDLSGARFSWRSGKISGANYRYRLSRGSVEFRKKSLLTTLTGQITSQPPRSSAADRRIFPAELGAVQNINLPLNLSMVADARSLQAALAARGGEIEFEQINFDKVWLLGSYNSDNPEKTGLSGRFRGPQGNNWSVSGELDGALRFEAQPLDLELSSELPGLRKLSRFPPISLEAAGLMFQFNQPFKDWTDYYGYLNFETGSARSMLFELSRLNGELEVTSDQVKVSSLYAAGQKGDINFLGGIQHTPDFSAGEWGLEIDGKNIHSGDLLRQFDNFSVEDLDINCEIGGALKNPRLTGKLSGKRINIFQVLVRDLKSSLVKDTGGLQFKIERGRVGEGDLQGNLRTEPSGQGQLDLKLIGSRVEKMFKFSDKIKQYLRGKITAELNSSGQTADLDSWQGTLEVSHSELRMDSFPVAGGLDKVANIEEIGRDLKIRPGKNTFEISDGIIILDGFRLQSENVELKGKGRVRLADRRINSTYRLILTGEAVKRYLQDVLGDLYRKVGIGEERRIEIEFEVNGSLADPEITIKRDKINRNFRENLVNNILSNVLGKPVNEVLDVFFD